MKYELYTAPKFNAKAYSKDLAWSVFLAGTIDKNQSRNWQQEILLSVNDWDFKPNKKVKIYNPRRDKFDLTVRKTNGVQILWEQFHLDKADFIPMFICNDSKSPICLLELGLYAQSGKLNVYCPESYYRFDNVILTCKKYKIPLISEDNEDKRLSIMINQIKKKISEL